MAEVAFTPAMTVTPDALEFQGLQGYGARVRHDSVCSICGQPFTNGQRLTAHLAENWDEATLEHDDCVPAL